MSKGVLVQREQHTTGVYQDKNHAVLTPLKKKINLFLIVQTLNLFNSSMGKKNFGSSLIYQSNKCQATATGGQKQELY